MPDTYDWTALAAPFAPGVVKQREGPGGKTLDYIDARDVMDRLDAVIGPGNWQDEYEIGVNGEWICTLSIYIRAEWVGKSGAGVNRALTEKEKGSKFEEDANRKNIKGGASDAFKRAAVKWGIARYLYQDKPASAPRPTPQPNAQATPISERKELVARIAKTWYGGNQTNALAFLKKLYETKDEGQRVIHARMDDVVIWETVSQWVWPDALPGQMLLQGLAKHPEHAYNRLNKMCLAGRIGITDSTDSILAEVERYQAEKTHQDS